MAVVEEPPKDIIESELKRPDTQRLLRENFCKEGQRWTSSAFRAGYVFAFELSDSERASVLSYKEREGVELLDALKALGFIP